MRTKGEEVETGVTYVPSGEGRSLWVLGELVTYKTTSEQTGGAYSLFEVTTQPGGRVLPHIQHREDESFYVLEGEYEFLDNRATMRVSAGSLIYVPRGNLHGHKNVGDKPARMLISQTPGGLHERFFEEIGEPAVDRSEPSVSEGSQDMRRIIAIAVTYGIEIPPSSRSVGQREETRREGEDGVEGARSLRELSGRRTAVVKSNRGAAPVLGRPRVAGGTKKDRRG